LYSADLRNLVHSARHQRTLQDLGYGLVYHAMCLFTFQLSPDTHASLPAEGGLSRLGYLVLRRGRLPVERRSFILARTWPSVE